MSGFEAMLREELRSSAVAFARMLAAQAFRHDVRWVILHPYRRKALTKHSNRRRRIRGVPGAQFDMMVLDEP